MTANEYFQKAKKSAHTEIVENVMLRDEYSYANPVVLNVYADTTDSVDRERDADAIMSAPITRENAVSESTLLRALIGSAVIYEGLEYEGPPGLTATLKDESACGSDNDEALDNLLALLHHKYPSKEHQAA